MGGKLIQRKKIVRLRRFMFINGLCNKERMILRCLAVETKVIKGKFSKLMSYIVFSFTLKGKFFSKVT